MDAPPVRRFAAALAATGFFLLQGAAFSTADQPWGLRNLYKIPIESGILVYAEDTAEWRVLMSDGQVLADRVGFCVVLEDGTELKGIDLGDGESSREDFTHELGEGTTYSVTFPINKGLRIVHTLRTFRARPFVFVEISVENVGTAEVQVAAIKPVIAETSVMQALSPQARVRHRRVLATGGQPVAAPQSDATMAVIHDPAKPISFGVGIIPSGLARAKVEFSESGGVWHGDIACHYEPYKVLKPGETLAGDSLWISHGVPEPERVDLYYSWAYSTFVTVPEREFKARGWYTLPEDRGLDAYVGAAARWKSAGINHALIGRGWEGRPGSMDGASPRFPKNMKGAFDALQQAGIQVGISLDPLSARKAGDAGTATSSDGLVWIDPTTPEGARAITEKIASVKSWGANFVIVEQSLIPDEALIALGLTRAEAQDRAYTALRDAAAPLAVFPCSISSVNDSVDSWLDAGSSVASMAIYGTMPGPLQLAMSPDLAISTDLKTAAQFWPGPIEFRGELSGKLSDDIAQLVRMERIAAQPVDAGMNAPRIWRVKTYDMSGNVVEDRTITLSGATADAPVALSSEATPEAAEGATDAG